MFYPSIWSLFFPKNDDIWIEIKILKETEKAILVDACCQRLWIAKSQIKNIKFKKGVFEVRVWERVVPGLVNVMNIFNLL